MASKSLSLVFRCTLPQLTAAAQRTLGLRNLVDADSIIRNLLHTVPNSDAIQSLWCRGGQGDSSEQVECTVTLLNYVPDEDHDQPSASEPSDPTEFHKAAKALQDLIFPELPV